MKRKSVALVVLLVVTAALGAANYYLNHPPLSQADKLFRQMVDRADEVVIIKTDLSVAPDEQMNAAKNPPLARLQGDQIQELEAVARLSDAPCFYAGTLGSYGLRFYRQRQLLGGVNVVIAPDFAALQAPGGMPFPFDADNRAKSRHFQTRFKARFATFLMQVASARYENGRLYTPLQTR